MSVKKALILLGLALAVLTGEAVVAIASAPPAHADDRGGGASGGGPGAWKDPYPTMPTDNDPAFVGTKWHPGPMVGGNLLEYLAQVPMGIRRARP